MKWILLVACFFVPYASAADPSKTTEILKVSPYPSAEPWKEITNQSSENGALIEWIPSNQSPDDIQDILTQQVFYGLKGDDPAAFVNRILAGVGKSCERARVNGPKKQNENGYAVAYAQAYCTNQKGAAKDVDIFIKAIRGKDALYIVQREFRRPAQPGAVPGTMVIPKDQVEEMKARLKAESAANDFLISVLLCPLAGGTGKCATPN